jgi:hypothetical protein
MAAHDTAEPAVVEAGLDADGDFVQAVLTEGEYEVIRA